MAGDEGFGLELLSLPPLLSFRVYERSLISISSILSETWLSMFKPFGRRGMTPLHLAAEAGNVAKVKDLLQESNNSGFVKDDEGRTPLHCAVRHGRISAVRELLRACPESVMEVTRNGDTPLHTAVKHHQLEALWVLVEEGLKPINMEKVLNWKNKEGNTVLHLAVSAKQFQMMALLLEKWNVSSGAFNVNAVNSRGFTALDIFCTDAYDPFHIEIEVLLRQSGCLTAIEVLKARPQHAQHQAPFLRGWDKIGHAIPASLRPENTRQKLRRALLVTSLLLAMVTFCNIIAGMGFFSANNNSRLRERLFVVFNSGGFFSSMAMIWFLVRRELASSAYSYWLLLLMSSLLGSYMFSVAAKSPTALMDVLVLAIEFVLFTTFGYCLASANLLGK